MEENIKKIRHFSATAATNDQIKNPWSDVNKRSTTAYDYDAFVKDVDLCRFFYKTEPMVSTVINKLVEIGVNDIIFSKNGLSDNEFRVFLSIKQDLLDFAESMAQEYLLSGLVVPEFTLGKVGKEFIAPLGIKKYTSLFLPASLWVRDPKSIKIYANLLNDRPSYFVKIPDEFVKFIRDKGKLPDGTVNKDLYNLVVRGYPEMVKAIANNKTEILLEDDKLILRRKYLPDNPYPIPYINPALEALQHKRKLRRMDYSIIDKVISAIMHVKVGSDEFPITDSEEDQSYIEDIRGQLRMRANDQQNLERIFQLITNHVVDISWVYPNTDTLLNVDKYKDINQEILFGLGFPRVLITGESEKTGTSDPEMAMIAPIRTMENFRRKVLVVIQEVCKAVSVENKFKNVPQVTFTEINMHKFTDFLNGLTKLFDISAISRTSYAEALGYDFASEVDKLEMENDELRSRGLSPVGLSPYSSPDLQGGEKPAGTSDEEDTSDGNQDVKEESTKEEE